MSNSFFPSSFRTNRIHETGLVFLSELRLRKLERDYAFKRKRQGNDFEILAEESEMKPQSLASLFAYQQLMMKGYSALLLTLYAMFIPVVNFTGLPKKY